MIPIIRGCGTAIIQSGRVLTLARMLSISTVPLAYLLSGIMVDYELKLLFTHSNTLLNVAQRIQGNLSN